MKPITITSLLVTCLLFLSLHLAGQTVTTTFSPATVSGAINATVDLDLKVTGITNIISIQFPVTYQSSSLQFLSADNFALPGFGPANYNSLTGKVNVSWFADLGSNPNGVTLPAGTTLMRMHFKILAGGTTAVNLANVTPGIEVINASGNPVTVNYQAGSSSVSGVGAPPPITGFHIIANGGNVGAGQKYCLPVTVNDFDNIISMQYAMHWNSTMLKFDSTSSYNLPFLTSSNFVANQSTGTLLLSWYDQNAVGVSKPDGATIYKVCFTATGPVGNNTLVTIDGQGFPGNPGAEIANSQGQNIWTPSVPVNDTVFIVAAPPPPANPNAPTFKLDTVTTQQNGTICVDLKVTNFDTLLSAQFGITYDPTKLMFQNLQFGSNPLALSAGGNFNTTNPGQIRFSWSDGSGLGKTLADGTVIFSACFKAIGACPDTVQLPFAGFTGFPIEIVKENGGETVSNFKKGAVIISCAPPAPTCTITSQTNISCFGGNNGAIDLTAASGTGTYTYSWAGPAGFPGSTNADLSNLTLPGTYTVTVTSGTTTTCSATITAPTSSVAIPANQIAVNAVKCFGGSDGLININVTGGTQYPVAPLYRFDWSNDGPENPDNDAEDLLNVIAGTYTVTVTDANGCTATSTSTVGQPSTALAVAASGTPTGVKCKGQSNGGACVTVTGGTAPYSYVWKNGSNQVVANIQCPTNLAGGPHSVTVADANNCQAIAGSPIIIPEPSVALSVSLTPVNNVCPGGNSGVVTANAGNGWGQFTYAWSTPPGGNSNVLPNLTAGTYTVTVTDQNGAGCAITATATVTSPPAITITDIAVTDLNCANSGDGEICLTPQGGNGAPYTVSWSPAGAGTCISNLAGGTYVPTVRDALNCSSTMGGIEVLKPDELVLEDEVVTNQTGATPNGAVSLTVVGGTAPYTFLWSNGAQTEDISGLPAATYTVTVTDDHDCSVVSSYVVIQSNPLIGSDICGKSDACGNTGEICVDISLIAQPPFTLDWGSGFMTNVLMHNATIENLTPGVYTVNITDVDGNNFSLNAVTISGLAPATVSDQINLTDCNTQLGAILLTAVPVSQPMLYLWNDGTTNSARVNLPHGTYTVTVTNFSSQCTAVYSYTLSCPAGVASSSVSNANCANAANGAIDFTFTGGDGPNYTYLWSTGATSQDISGLSAGNYTVTVTDESAVTYISTYAVGVNSTMAITNVNILSNYGGYEVSGFGECDGQASVALTGAVGQLNYLWSNGATTPTANDLCSGDFSVIVTDQLGCTSTWTDNLSSPAEIASEAVGISSFNGYNVSCYGRCDGIARVFVEGGIPPYTIQWPTGQVEELDFEGDYSTASNLCGGTYTVTITDAFGVVRTKNVGVSEPDELVLTFANVPPTSFSRCDGEAIVIATGAVGTVNFTWTASITGQTGTGITANALCSGERVQFVAQDANGCIASANDTIPFPTDGCYRVRPVLTPGQQDGKNDFVYITCIESTIKNSIEIYNRWGTLVFATEGYDNSANFWDGTDQKKRALPEGVYYYILNFTDVLGDHQVKGHINLLR